MCLYAKCALQQVFRPTKQYALISEYVLISDMRLVTRKYGILEKLEELGLNCEYLRGQGYDGSGSMAGIRKGASSIILQKYPLASYVHCRSHILNLSIASSCSQVLVCNMMGSVSEVSKFFELRKRQAEVIEHELPEEAS